MPAHESHLGRPREIGIFRGALKKRAKDLKEASCMSKVFALLVGLFFINYFIVVGRVEPIAVIAALVGSLATGKITYKAWMWLSDGSNPYR